MPSSDAMDFDEILRKVFKQTFVQNMWFRAT